MLWDQNRSANINFWKFELVLIAFQDQVRKINGFIIWWIVIIIPKKKKRIGTSLVAFWTLGINNNLLFEFYRYRPKCWELLTTSFTKCKCLTYVAMRCRYSEQVLCLKQTYMFETLCISLEFYIYVALTKDFPNKVYLYIKQVYLLQGRKYFCPLWRAIACLLKYWLHPTRTDIICVTFN